MPSSHTGRLSLTVLLGLTFSAVTETVKGVKVERHAQTTDSCPVQGALQCKGHCKENECTEIQHGDVQDDCGNCPLGSDGCDAGDAGYPCFGSQPGDYIVENPGEPQAKCKEFGRATIANLMQCEKAAKLLGYSPVLADSGPAGCYKNAIDGKVQWRDPMDMNVNLDYTDTGLQPICSQGSSTTRHTRADLSTSGTATTTTTTTGSSSSSSSDTPKKPGLMKCEDFFREIGAWDWKFLCLLFQVFFSFSQMVTQQLYDLDTPVGGFTHPF